MSGDLAEVADKSVRGSLLLFLGEAVQQPYWL
jgi:hypothetical protein